MTQFRNTIGLRLTMMFAGLELPSIKREEGQTLAEYAMILALIAAVVAGALIFLRGKITDLFTTIGNSI